MILPGKHLQQDRALLGIGAEILGHLDEERTVSELWGRIRSARGSAAIPLSFDWFVLALTFLYAVAAVDHDGSVIKARPHL